MEIRTKQRFNGGLVLLAVLAVFLPLLPLPLLPLLFYNPNPSMSLFMPTTVIRVPPVSTKSVIRLQLHRPSPSAKTTTGKIDSTSLFPQPAQLIAPPVMSKPQPLLLQTPVKERVALTVVPPSSVSTVRIKPKEILKSRNGCLLNQLGANKGFDVYSC